MKGLSRIHTLDLQERIRNEGYFAKLKRKTHTALMFPNPKMSANRMKAGQNYKELYKRGGYRVKIRKNGNEVGVSRISIYRSLFLNQIVGNSGWTPPNHKNSKIIKK